MKKLLIILGVVVLLILIAVIFLPGPIARPVAQKVATSTLKVDVGIEKLTASLFSGSVGLAGLDVGNPEGFEKDFLTQISKIEVDAKITSFMGDTAVIENVLLEGMELNIESKGGKTNISALLKNLEGDSEASTEEEPEGEGMKFQIKLITLKDIKVVFSSAITGAVKLTITELQVKDVGSEDNGAALKDVLKIVLKKVAAKAMDLGKDLTGALGDQFKKIDMGSLGDSLGDVGKGIGDGGKNILEGIKNPVKDLFK